MNILAPLLAAGAALALAGCAATPPVYSQAKAATDRAVRAAQAESRRPRVEETDRRYLPRAVEIEVEDDRNAVALVADNTPFYGLVQALARQAGYTVAAADGVDLQRRVQADIRGADSEAAIRQLVFLAGYAAVFNHADRSVLVADQATYTFRIPPNALRRLSATYAVGGNPVAQSSTPGGGSGGSTANGSSSGSANVKAEFTVNGVHSTNPAGLGAFLRGVAGRNVDVQIDVESGLLVARGNGQALKRLHDFLTAFSRDALRQVEILASIVEVALTDEFQYGISWERIVRNAGGRMWSIGVDTAALVTQPSFSATYTTASIDSVLNALQRYTTIDVISQPSLVALNDTPATIFDGQQIPYLPAVQAQISGVQATTTISGQGAFATDGVSLSITPSILDARTVQITLIPVTSAVRGFEDFKLQQNTSLRLPRQETKQSFMQVLVESGRTVILGGNRTRGRNDTRTGVPGVADVPVVGALIGARNDTASQRELVVLLRANILPAPRYNPLVAEAL